MEEGRQRSGGAGGRRDRPRATSDWEGGDERSSHPKVLAPLSVRNPHREVCFETEGWLVVQGRLWGPRR